MNHNTKTDAADFVALERRYRPQIVAGLRAAGLSYGEIRRTLGIPLRQVEKQLGEAAALRAQGYSVAEVAAELGVPAGSMGRILPGPRQDTATERQAEVLSATSHMHGLQIDVLAEFLSVHESSAYAIARVLVDNGWASLAKVQRGRAWLYPKRDVAARYLGWRPSEWEPPLMFAHHYRAVAQARIMLVGSDPQAWVSERVLRHEAGKRLRAEAEARNRKPVLEFSTGREPMPNRPHVHDGWFCGVIDGTYGWWALEVELTEKDPNHLDSALAGAFRSARDAQPHRLVGVLYLCRTERVIAAVTAAKKRLPRELADLPLLFAVGDFDEQWQQHTDKRRAMRAAKSANRHRDNLIRLSKEAS
ncbi:hypothetical protein [Nocardia cerradoensis]|uniref:Uncharacterized protein n=1 Tax=Nocardia cerradoensis TaxID=85688 RepID=A0A231GTJ6_9NOCA|nr:hypothetical protein [Nocardia cerradoensis]NKY48381.1 hypothetical protein [Nocardia cerradoensis]OXR39939.1 hypothetical protein B7C42_08002 [Nocardia cerradoensis]